MFQNHPQVIGLSGDLSEPGSFLTNNDFGVAILARRNADGEFKAFVNACSHRGAMVEERDRGQASQFTCPYHAWTFSGDGELLAYPKKHHFGEVDKSCHGLIELPAQEHMGFLIVHPQADGEIDIDQFIPAELQAELENWNISNMGSGGPIADDARAGAGNIVWSDGKALVVVDAGPGSFLRHAEAGVDFRDHLAILLTHFHGDHVDCLPGLLNSGSFARRTDALLVAGPQGSDLFPATSESLEAMVGKTRALRYLSSYLEEDGPPPLLIIRDIPTNRDYLQAVHRKDGVNIDTIAVDHLGIPGACLCRKDKRQTAALRW